MLSNTAIKVMAALLVLALVGASLFGIYSASQASEISQREQSEADVRIAAERFTETWNTFSPDDVQGYIDAVTPLLSTKFAADFTSTAADVTTGITQQQLQSTGTVLTDSDEVPLVGISTMDQDSAEVLVISDASRISGEQEVLRYWRWQVSLIKSDGKWLVDEFKAL